MKIRGRKGITLISLVVTIIILIILAGVTINLTIGDNGLFNLAKKAKSDYEQALINEEAGINELYEYLAREGELPENTKDTDAGKEVKLPEGWYEASLKYVSTEDGSVVKEAKSTSVIAVAAGNGETVPVPGGFYYVGGNFSTGVVISDNKAEQNKYVGETEVGIDLEGNQFVWIPCAKEEYKKCNVWNGTIQNNSTLGNAWWDTTTNSSEITQIQKYGGFYVARYEAGLAETIPEYTTAQYNNNTNQIYNKDGIPQSKAGVIPWIFIDWDHAQENAQNMYKTNYVSSGLITGTQWDVMINKVASIEGKSLINCGEWGNYYNSELTYTGRCATYNSSTRYLSTFGEVQTNVTKSANTYTMLTTGASKTTKVYNLYDVAGNVWEWTEEDSKYNGNIATQYRELRGGSLHHAPSAYSVCYRNGQAYVTIAGYNGGFRVVLYIK